MTTDKIELMCPLWISKSDDLIPNELNEGRKTTILFGIKAYKLNINKAIWTFRENIL